MLLTSQQALKELGLSKEIAPGVWRGNHRYLYYLKERNLLPRVILGPRTFRYELEDCQNLLEKSKEQGLHLIIDPKKKAA